MGDKAISLWFPCVPPRTTAQMKRLVIRDGKPVFFKGRKVSEAETMFALMLLPHIPPAPLEGPLKLTVVATWPHPKKASKWLRANMMPKTTRPDLDNWVKGLIDQLIALKFIHDDSQVCELHAEKYVGPEDSAGISLTLEPFTIGTHYHPEAFG